MSAELYLQPENHGVNRVTGRYMKGHVPSNKGKQWDEWMPKKSQAKAAMGWKNADLHRPTVRPDTAERCRKQVVAVTDDGQFRVFNYLGAAAKWIGGSRENIGRCCRENASQKPLSRPWSKRNGKGTDKQPNTDHRYMGVRWYFESDNIWTTKINKQ